MIKNLLPTVWRRNELPLRHTEGNPLFVLHRDVNRMFDEFFRSLDLSPFDTGRDGGTYLPQSTFGRVKKNRRQGRTAGGGREGHRGEPTDSGLTTTGEKKAEKEETGKNCWHRETSYGAFHWSSRFPRTSTLRKVDARFKNGVLTVTLARQEEAKPKGKRIAIKAE